MPASLDIRIRRDSTIREIVQSRRRSAGLSGSEYKAGDDLLSRWTHYHRPRVLNGRVRNGNGCVHPGMVTGKFGRRSARRGRAAYQRCIGWQRAGLRVARSTRGTDAGAGGNAAKRSAVSTGQLRRIAALTHPAYRPGGLPGAFVLRRET